MGNCLCEFDVASWCLSAEANKCHLSVPMWIWTVTLGLVLWVSLSAAWAETIYVDDTTGAIFKNGKCSISEAIENANTDTQVNPDCPAGKYDDTIRLTTNVKLTQIIDSTDGGNGTPSITSIITLDGQTLTLQRVSDSSCTLDGIIKSDEFRLLHVNSTGNLTLENITLENGCVDGIGNEASGGAIFNRGTMTVLDTTLIDNKAGYYGGGLFNLTPAIINTIDNSTFQANMAKDGGGIYNYGDVLVEKITNSNFSENLAARYGGGLFNDFISTVISITHSTFSENGASYGGAIYNDAGNIGIFDRTILQVNTATYGGAIYNRYNGKITSINGCVITNNSAYSGGGLYNDQYSRIDTIINSAFSGNSADGGGGAIYNIGTLPELHNNTFSDNLADLRGAGIYNIGTLTTLTNSTFSSNMALSGSGIYNSNTLSMLTNSTFSGNLKSSIENSGLINKFSNNIITKLDSHLYADCVNNSGTIGGGNNLIDNLGNCPFWLSILRVTNFDTTLKDNGCVIPGPNGCIKTHALLAGSNAINAAVNGTASDQRGFPAIGIRDIGAYEFEFTFGGCFPYTPAGKTLMICW